MSDLSKILDGSLLLTPIMAEVCELRASGRCKAARSQQQLTGGREAFTFDGTRFMVCVTCASHYRAKQHRACGLIQCQLSLVDAD